MTDQLPERIWAHPFTQTWDDGVYYKTSVEYLRADTAIPKIKADAMVAAVVDACAEVLEECGIDGSAFAQTFEEYRRGRAAFEQAVQKAVEKAQREWALKYLSDESQHLEEIEKAVEAERERWQTAITLIERVYYMEGKDAKWRAAHMNGIARDAQNGLDLAWARRMFPRDSEALSEARKVHAEEAAAIRAQQETSE